MRITARSPCSVFCRHEIKIRLVGGKEGGGVTRFILIPGKRARKKNFSLSRHANVDGEQCSGFSSIHISACNTLQIFVTLSLCFLFYSLLFFLYCNTFTNKVYIQDVSQKVRRAKTRFPRFPPKKESCKAKR